MASSLFFLFVGVYKDLGVSSACSSTEYFPASLPFSYRCVVAKVRPCLPHGG